MSDSIKQKVTKWKVIYVSCSISINEIKVLQKFKNLINRWFYTQFDLTFLKIIALLLIMFAIIVPKLAMWKLNVVLWQINFVVVSQRDRRSFRLVEIRLKVSKQNIMDHWAKKKITSYLKNYDASLFTFFEKVGTICEPRF